MLFRNYDVERDKETAHRIWREIGWLEKGQEEGMDYCVNAGRALVAEINGEAEALVLTAPGTIRYLEEDLTLGAVTGVTVSRLARKQGVAGRLTAKAIAQDAEEGALVSGLSMFEQGYYNQLGFGTGVYENRLSFDPALLTVQVKARIPRRLTKDDWEIMHSACLNRMRGHGSCNLLPSDLARAEIGFSSDTFGLGYFDGENGELTHFIWCKEKGESGPYVVYLARYQTHTQFLELMALLKNLGDQVRLISLREPPNIQLQDLIRQPFKHRQVSKKSEFESGSWSNAYWQLRMNDIPGCLAKTHLEGKSLRFQLHLTDPIETLLDSEQSWRGTSGDYIVTLGEESSATLGADASLPELTATTNAFSRMWLGVRPATGLAATDHLSGSPELLAQLDKSLRLPTPRFDWDY